jgi:hypothetical protein
MEKLTSCGHDLADFVPGVENFPDDAGCLALLIRHETLSVARLALKDDVEILLHGQ